MNIKQHEQTWVSFINFVKYGTVASIIIFAIVIYFTT
jgi:hypothetical protein